MDMETLQPILAGIMRHALTTVGGALAAKGIMNSGTVNEFVGAGMVLAGVAWSWWQKQGQAAVSAELKALTAKK